MITSYAYILFSLKGAEQAKTEGYKLLKIYVGFFSSYEYLLFVSCFHCRSFLIFVYYISNKYTKLKKTA
jgi:hypothetical protein